MKPALATVAAADIIGSYSTKGIVLHDNDG